MVYLGVDPGKSGGLAWVTAGGMLLGALPMPATERDVWDCIESLTLRRADTGVHACVEQVGGYVGQAQPGSSAFKFGLSYGGLRMALVGLKIPFTTVVPAKWQRGVGVIARKRGENQIETRVQYKNRLKARAQELFPTTKVTLATADAILLAEYCRNQRGK